MAEGLITKEDLKKFSGKAKKEGPIHLLAEPSTEEQAPTAKPSRIGQLAKLAINPMEAPLVGAAAGGHELANLLLGAGTLPINVARGLLGKQYIKAPKVAPLQVGAEHPLAKTLGRIGGGAVGYGLAEMAAAPAKTAKVLAPLLGKGAQLVGEAVPGAIYGGAQAPETPGKGAILGGALGAGLGVAGRGLAKAGKAASQRAEIIYPQAKEALDNMLERLRGSSSKETSSQDIFDRASQHFEELKGSNKQGDILSKGSWIHPKDSIRAAYNKPKDISREFGVKINMKPYLDKMNEYKGAEISKYARFGKETLPPDVKEYLEERLLQPNIATFEEADLGKQHLNDEFGRFQINDPKRHLVLEAKEGLRDSVRKSTTDSIDENIKKLTSENKKTNREEIKSLKNKKESISKLWEDADKKYIKELLPFKQTPGGKVNTSPFYKRYAKGSPLSGMTEEYLKPGNEKDQFEFLNNLMHMMPDEESKNLVAYHYLRNQEGDPAGILKQYNKLGGNQKNTLFNEKDKQALDKMAQVYKKNPSLFKEPSKVKGALVKAAMNAPKYFGLAGMASGHIPAGLALLAAPTAERAGLNLLAKGAGKETLSPLARSLLMSEALGTLGENK